MRKYSREEVKELLKFFKKNGILLINKESIGEVDLSCCEINEEWICGELTIDKID